MKNIQIQDLKIEILQQQSAIFSGNNIQYKSFLKKKENKGFGNVTGTANHLFHQSCTVKNFEKS